MGADVINFPDSPTLNQVFSTVGCSWKWDGVKWTVAGSGDVVVPAIPMIPIDSTTTLTTGFNGFVSVGNTTSAPITVTMPSSPTTSQKITIKDIVGNASLYPITISGGAALIEGASTLVLTYNYSWVDLIYTGSKWVQT